MAFEITASSLLHYGANSFSSSYVIPISPRPFFHNASRNKFHLSHTPNHNFTPFIKVSINNNASNSNDLLPNELEFKPSFDHYLKAMESSKSVTGNNMTVKKVDEGNHRNVRNSKRLVGAKIFRKKDVAFDDEAIMSNKEGFCSGNGNVRGKVKKVIKKVEYGGIERNLDDGKGNVRQDRLNRRSRSLDSKSDDCSVINKSRGKIGYGGGVSNEIVRSNSNGRRGGSVVEREIVSSRGRTSGGSGGNFVGRKNVVMDRGPAKIYAEIEGLVNGNGRSNVKSNGRSKRFVNRGYDADNLEVARVAFKNLEDPNNVISKAHFSHKEMEERIQKLAKLLNGVDINLPEWMFSKMIRSAKLKFNDYSIRRLITILGNLGNWQRVIQVIEWLQKRERFQSHKPRHVYSAALDALGKLKRPVEALNVFHAMQQEMSTYPDLVAYHSIAVTLGQAGHMKQLFDVIDIMRSPPKKKFNKGIFENWDPRLEPDIIVYNAVLNACAKWKQWEGAFWVLQQLKKQGIQPSAATYGLVMEVMFSCGKYNLVHEFFRKLQKSSIPNPLTYRVLVNTFWKEGKMDEAASAVREMERRGIVGSASLYYDLARCLCAAGRSREALMQIDKICKVANKPLVVTYTGLMQACLDSGKIQDGAYIFEKMKDVCAPNLVTYNIMLKAYIEHGMFQEAKELFEQMLENTNHLSRKDDYKMRVIPDIYTFNTILDACAAEKRWDYFDYVYQRMLYQGYHFNPKRHLRLVLEASRAGKEELLEITWKHLAVTDRIPPVSVIKERFCTKLENDDYVAALKCITSHTPKDFEPFSKSSWLNLFKENSHRFRKDTVVRLMNAASNLISNNSVPNPALVCLVQSCNEFCFATDLSAADMDSVNNVFVLESK
ncbi:pentatricopeptide repeat-containing protein At1g30610, chloroplastic [Cicer arietinum]|uniref:Pentatricopeptide repeat-containing protein At1g30610, chloroplastic n=1 Tax=Cicer arietinum TaxID=3827 RepID=A0A1S2XWC4_CICAR|nr:pentatricopeptide repeat-containing protein At1g30610, chloroplastic [Cicer arietinum]